MSSEAITENKSLSFYFYFFSYFIVQIKCKSIIFNTFKVSASVCSSEDAVEYSGQEKSDRNAPLKHHWTVKINKSRW